MKTSPRGRVGGRRHDRGQRAALVEGSRDDVPPGERFETACKVISSRRQSLKKGPYCRLVRGKQGEEDAQRMM